MLLWQWENLQLDESILMARCEKIKAIKWIDKGELMVAWKFYTFEICHRSISFNLFRWETEKDDSNTKELLIEIPNSKCTV